MSDYLNTRLGEIGSGDVLTLITELEVACVVSSGSLINMTLWHFLVQCVYPTGTGQKRQPIAAKYLPEDGFLGTALRKLNGNDVFSLCEELAHRNHTSLEFSLGQKLAGFLNANIPKFPPSKKLTAAQQRRENLAMLRRNNRR